MALKEVPHDSKLADPVPKARSQLADVLKKKIFLPRTLGHWCEEILDLEKPPGWSNGHAESGYDTSPVGSIKFGLKLVYTAQETIDDNFSAVYRDNPELHRTREQRESSGVAPRRQALIDHGIVARPEAVIPEQSSWRGLRAQLTRVLELVDQRESSKTAVASNLAIRPEGNLITRSESPISFEDVAHIDFEMDDGSDRHDLDVSAGSVGTESTTAGEQRVME